MKRFYFFNTVLVVCVIGLAGCANLQTEEGVYSWAKGKGDICSWEYYIREFPQGGQVSEAKKRIVKKQPSRKPWNSVAEGMADLDDIDSVYYDPDDGELKFIGDNSGRLPPLIFDDLIECLDILISGHEIGVSIEPKAGIKTGKTNIGEPMHIRYIPDTVKNSHLGNTLYEIDRKLKSLSLGQDNITNKQVSSEVRGFKTITSRVQSSGLEQRETGYFGLIWFQPDEPEVEIDGFKLSFRNLNMKLLPDGQHPSLKEFAQHVTNHFEEYADKEVVFAELRRIHKLVIIARWLNDLGFPLDKIRKYPRIKVQTPKKTPSVFAVYQEEKWDDGYYSYIQQYGLIGGINLSPPTRYYIPTTIPSRSMTQTGTHIVPYRYVPVSRRSSTFPRFNKMIANRTSLPPDCKNASLARPGPKTYYWNIVINGQSKRVVAVPLT